MGHFLEKKYMSSVLRHSLWVIASLTFLPYSLTRVKRRKIFVVCFDGNIQCIFRGCSFWSRLGQISSGTLGPGLTNTWTDSGDKRGKYSLPFGQIYFPFGQIMFVQIKNIWSRLVQISLVRLTNTRIHSGDQRDNYNLPFGQLHLACGKIHFVQMAKCIWSRFPWSVWAILGQTVGQKRQEGGRTAQLRPKEGIDIRMKMTRKKTTTIDRYNSFKQWSTNIENHWKLGQPT